MSVNEEFLDEVFNQEIETTEEFLDNLLTNLMVECIDDDGVHKQNLAHFTNYGQDLKEAKQAILQHFQQDRPVKPKVNEMARIVNSHFLDSEYQGKDWEAVRLSLIEKLTSHFQQEQERAVLEARLDEWDDLYDEDTPKHIALYRELRIEELQEELQSLRGGNKL
jgi:hypothetical protein